MKAASPALILALATFLGSSALAAEADPLAVGVAGHAFDHLGGISEQADAAADSGANIIYATGVGGAGYFGLPPAQELDALRQKSADYVRHAKQKGIRLAIGYVCATSIVNLPEFDKNWSKELRSQFSSPPKQWLQLDRNGNPLPSWYGRPYAPACMNNPDWRAYEKHIVEMQFRAGHDGIFFDNPTVHPQGCYCEHCMRKFAAMLQRDEKDAKLPELTSIDALRQLPAKYPQQFLRFRASIAADFLKEIRDYARTINPKAIITGNNSLNAPEAFYSQCRSYGYNIHAMSQVEDLVVVEDEANQPRTLADGRVMEYGPVYEMLHAVSHNKPVVAVTIAEGDYHTPPNLMRLAMAEAAAHRAAYLSWPTWPAPQRQKMIAGVRPLADLLRQHADLLNDTHPLADVAVYLPFSRWLETTQCQPLDLCRELSRKNLQFIVLDEDSLAQVLEPQAAKVLLVESTETLGPKQKETVDRFTAAGGRVIWSGKKDWLKDLQSAVARPVIVIDGQATLRAVAATKDHKTIVHLLNLNIARVSSIEDRVTPAADVKVRIRCGFKAPHSIEALTADEGATRGNIPFKVRPNDGDTVEITLPSLHVSTILVIQ